MFIHKQGKKVSTVSSLVILHRQCSLRDLLMSVDNTFMCVHASHFVENIKSSEFSLDPQPGFLSMKKSCPLFYKVFLSLNTAAIYLYHKEKSIQCITLIDYYKLNVYAITLSKT